MATTAVEFGGEGGDGFDAGFGVPVKGAWVLVAAIGLEQDGGDSFFAKMGER